MITPTRVVVARAVEGVLQLEQRLRTEGVALLRPVDGDLGDARCVAGRQLVPDVAELALGPPLARGTRGRVGRVGEGGRALGRDRGEHVSGAGVHDGKPIGEHCPTLEAMSRPATARPLVRVPVPPGAEGPARLLPALAAALDGSGPAIAPMPDRLQRGVERLRDVAARRRARRRPVLPLRVGRRGRRRRPRRDRRAPRAACSCTAAQLTALTDVVNGPGRPQWIAALPVTSMGGLNVLVRALATGREPVGGAEHRRRRAVHRRRLRGRRRRRRRDRRTTSAWHSCPPRSPGCCPADRGISALQRCTAHPRRRRRDPAVRCGRPRSELGITLTTTYGATETAGGCVFDGHPLPGVTVTADGERPASGLLTISGTHRGPRLPGRAGAHPRPASARPASAPPTSARSAPTARCRCSAAPTTSSSSAA